MNIFSGIPSGDGYDSISLAVTAIVQRVQALRNQGELQKRWSLAELRPDDEDFTWLCEWMRQLSYGIARHCVEYGLWRKFEIESEQVSYTTAIGTLLLFSASEIARREARERSLWASISRGRFSVTARQLLFPQGNPSRAYKDAVERAARWLKLRHVFGVQGLQNWYDTIYLQFGFSRQGMMRRLPNWLAGWGETFSIQELLRGQRMQSESFSEFWEMLKLFQRGNCTERQLRAIAGNSPWVLPEWINDLVRQAKVKPRPETGEIVTVENDEEDEAPFLDAPQLRWDIASPPRFTCSISNLARLDLQDETYDIVIAGRACGRLYRRSDGSYRATPSDEIELPLVAPQLPASLIGADGQVVQNLALQLWDENEDVTAFNKSSGRRFDPWKTAMRPNTDVLLLLSDDLILDPLPLHWHIFKQQRMKLYYLQSPWPGQTCVLLDDQVLWNPYLTTPPARNTEQNLASQIRILPDESTAITLGDSVRLRITLPANTQLIFLRTCGRPIEFEQFPATTVRTEGITITPASFGFEENYRIELLLGLRTATNQPDRSSATGITRLRVSAELPITGAAILTANGWTPLRSHDALEHDQASTQPVKMFLADIDTWDVLEGDVWVRHLSKYPRPLMALSGSGAPLKLSQGVYNMYKEPRALAREVIDHGNVAAITIEAPGIEARESTEHDEHANRALCIRLVRSIEPGMQHTIHWWDRTGSFHTFAPEGSEDHGMIWRAGIPADVTEPIAIAIAYNGTRLGSWWDERWSNAIRPPARQPAEMIAALLYWFHLPVLCERYLADVRSFVNAYPEKALAAWLGKSSLPPGLQWNELDDGWLSAIRTIFWNWRLTNISIQQFLQPLLLMESQPNFLDGLTSIAWKLLRVSPLLIGLVLKQWVTDECIPQWGKEQTRALVQQLIYNLADAESSAELRTKVVALEQDVATTMDVDPRFAQSLIQRACAWLKDTQQALKRLDQDNLAIAMNIEPFRRLLGIKLFEVIIQSIG